MSNKFAFSTNAFTRVSVEDAVAQIAEAGYAGLELMLDAPHIFPMTATSAQVNSIRNAVEKAGLAFSNANAFPMSAVGDTWNPSWIDPDPAVRRMRIQHTIEALRLAADLGIPHISTEPGGQLTQVADRNDALIYFIDGLDECLPVAEETGVDILVEPEPHLLLQTSDEYLDFAARISHPRLALNFDIGHFYCAGESPADSFRLLKAHARHVHFEDIAPTREHRHLLPGTGAIDLPGVVRTLSNERYTGWITVELYPYQDQPFETALAARDYIRSRIEGKLY